MKSTTFDWLTPLWTLVQDYRNRPTTGYSVPPHLGVELPSILRTHGVKAWGWTITDNRLTFRVRVAQARYAQYLMAREGIAYAGGVQL